MAIRWLYRTWSVFWTLIGVTVSVVVLLSLIAFGLLQLPTSKNYIAKKIEHRFNTQHEGVLRVGHLDGILPFNMTISSVKLYPDSSSTEPVFRSDTVLASLDVWSILQNKFVLTGMSIKDPYVLVDGESGNSIMSAIRRKKIAPQTGALSDSVSGSESEPFLEILAPDVQVRGGFVKVRNAFGGTDSLTLQNIDLAMFLEYKEDERFLDIDHLRMGIPELNIEELRFFGQVFNDEQFLEFNSIDLRTGESVFRFSGKADGVDLLKPDVISQIRRSKLQLNVNELRVTSENVQKLYPSFPATSNNLIAEFQGEGNVDSLWFDDFDLTLGNTGIAGFGYIASPFKTKDIRYSLEFENILIDTTEVKELLPKLTPQQVDAISDARYEAEMTGDLHSISGEVVSTSERGTMKVNGDFSFRNQNSFSAALSLISFNAGGLLTDKISSSSITGDIRINSSSLDYRSAAGKADIKLSSGSVNEISYDSLEVQSDWNNGLFDPYFFWKAGNSFVDGRGTVDVTGEVPSVNFSGSGTNLDLKALAQSESMNKVIADIEYDLFLSGTSADNLYGQASIDVPMARVENDTLPNHLFYIDFNEPGTDNRVLRLTSTAMDLSLSGEYSTTGLTDLVPYWRQYFEERYQEEILLNDIEPVVMEVPDIEDQNFALSATLKDFSLLNAYFPNLPHISTRMLLSSDFNANSERMLFNLNLRDQEFRYNDVSIDSLVTQLTGSFRRNEKLKDFAGFQLVSEAAHVSTDMISGKGINFSFDLDEDSVSVSSSVTRIADDTEFNLSAHSALSDTSIVVIIDNFELGQNLYKWRNQGAPAFTYNNSGKLRFEEFDFVNFEEFLSFDGVFSNQATDSVNYILRSVNLFRISELLDGKISFSGVLDGDFTTRTLTRTPTIQGELTVTGFALDNNVVGDIEVKSRLNSELNRFDTQIAVKTDSTIYPEYFTRSQRSGQNILLEGYVLAPEQGSFPDADSLFKFDLNFESVDLWIIPFIAPKVFTEMSGRASGKGMIWGNAETYDFSVNYQVGVDDAVFMKPRFIDTHYFAQGNVIFNRTSGLDFRDVLVIDPSGGTAILSGTLDFNDFKDPYYFDLALEMDEFQFLNNSFDPTVPFYGTAYGSTTVRLRGTNLEPVMSTDSPVQITDFSNISIPLLEETDFDENNKFIRFVDDFSFSKMNQDSSGSSASFISQSDIDQTEKSFMERITMDFSFVATQPMTVQLIFDPVTGDQIRADGTGRLRLRLEDEVVSMFGRFDITDGYYNFVSGDIFARRFQLQPGGAIIWEGSPADARLNLSAVYEARPDINTLSQARANIDRNASQRVPVQLVLDVGGSISQIENDFYFRLPNTFESRQNTTLSTQINALNSNEDEKFIQATSFLLMGDFIPSTSTGSNATNSLTDNFSGSGAVLNPLLSSQVISPLLSNQINSLLRSDIGSLDIDFNLNTYNNVDLAVALRLYNDRIILSREGQITGSQSNIGDIGATYRINQTLSVTAFHRQDPTFSNYSVSGDNQQAQDINGVGLEAQVSFNSWNEFFKRLGKPFRWLFGRKENSDEEMASNSTNTPS